MPSLKSIGRGLKQEQKKANRRVGKVRGKALRSVDVSLPKNACRGIDASLPRIRKKQFTKG